MFIQVTNIANNDTSLVYLLVKYYVHMIQARFGELPKLS